MRILKTLLLGIFVCTALGLRGQEFEWARSIGGSSLDLSRSMTVDALGNVYITGRFQGTVDFDPGAGIANLSSSGNDDIFIQKLDATGNFLWAKAFGASNFDEGFSITVDALGNVYTTGFFQGTVDFDPGTGTANLNSSFGSADIFIQKLDASGNFLWAKAFGSSGADIGRAIDVDGSGNVYTTGAFQGTIDFDPGAGTANLNSTGFASIFVQKMDASGNFLWAKSFGGTRIDQVSSINIDSSGNVYTVGFFEGTEDFDPGVGIANLSSIGGYDIFIQKLDAAGNFLWAKAFGGASFEIVYSIAFDASENVYTTGYFQGSVDFDPGTGTNTLSSAGSADIFVQKLDASGNFLWAKSFGSTSGDVGQSITVDAADNVYITGRFRGTVDFDPGAGMVNLSSAGSDEVFVQKLDPSGNFIWAKSFGSTSGDVGRSINLDASGNVYTSGWFEGSVDFDPGAGMAILNSSGSTDIFVQKMSQSSPPDIPTIALSSNDSICLGDSVDLLIASGNLNDATDWQWYAGSCGGPLLGTGDTIRVSPTSTTTYFVRGEGGGVTPGTCANQTIVPGNTGGGVSASVSDTLVCLGDQLTFTASGGTNYQWSGGITNAQTFTTTSPGILLSYVTGEDAFGCTSEDSAYSFVSESYSLADKGKFIGSGFESYVPLYFYCDAAETDSALYNFNSHWISFIDIFSFIFAPFGSGCPSTTSINQSSDAYEGLNALRMDADTNGFAQASISGILAGRPNKLQGYFKTNAGPNDTIAVLVGAVETGLPASSQDSANYIGYGEFVSTGSTGTYTQFEVPINYSGTAPTDSFEISLVFVNSALTGGVKSVWFDAFNLVYDTTVVSICSGDSAFLGGAWQTTTGLYTDSYTTLAGCDSVVLTELELLPAAIVNAGTDQAFCADVNTISLNGSFSNAVSATWSGGAGTFSPNANDPNAVYTPTAAEKSSVSVNLVLTTTGGGTCSMRSDTVSFTFDQVAMVEAGPNQNLCADITSLNLAGSVTNASGGIWSNGSGTFSPSNTALNATYTPTTTEKNNGLITLVLTSTGNGACSSSFDTVLITFDAAPTIANAGPDQVVCGLVTNFAANTISVGTGNWFQISGPPGIVISNSSPNASITATNYGTYVFEWRIENGNCPPSRDTVQITFDESPSPANAGPDQTVCGLTTALSANPISVGTGIWSQLSGPGIVTLTNANDPSTSASASSAGVYLLEWQSSNGSCPANADTVQITFNESPTTAIATASSDSVCGNSVNLNGNFPSIGSGLWTQISGPGTLTYIDDTANITTATASASGNYAVTWTISNGNCPPSVDSVSFAFFDNPTAAIAGADNTVCGLNTTLAGNTISVGTGSWSQVSGPGSSTFSNANLENSGVTVSAAGVYIFSWKSENGNCSPSEDFVQITFDEAPTQANAGPDQTTCDTVINMAANNISVGTGVWSAISGPGIVTFSNQNFETAVASFSIRGVYELTWTSSNGICPVSVDTVIISIDDEPSASNAGIDQILCDLSTNLSANIPSVGSGSWTQISGPGTALFFNVNSPSTNVSTTVAGAYTFEWTISNGSCPLESDQVNITFNELPLAQIDTSGSIDFCQGESITLNALSPGSGNYTYQWNDGNTPIAGATSSSLTVNSSGSYYVTITETGSLCLDSSQSITVTVNPRPTVFAGIDTAICAGELIQLFGSGAVNYTWDNGVTDGVAFTPTTTTTYTVIGFDGNNCSDTASITVTVNDLPNISLGQDTILCSDLNETVILDAGSGFASYLWSDGSTNQNLLVDNAFFQANGSSIWAEVTDNNTCRGSDTVDVSFTICVGLTGTGQNLIRNIYPNPTTGKVIIEMEESYKTQISILDQKGSTLRSFEMNGNQMELDLGDLPSAKYFIQIQGEGIDLLKGIIKN